MESELEEFEDSSSGDETSTIGSSSESSVSSESVPDTVVVDTEHNSGLQYLTAILHAPDTGINLSTVSVDTLAEWYAGMHSESAWDDVESSIKNAFKAGYKTAVSQVEVIKTRLGQ